jgi:hypothetical protein
LGGIRRDDNTILIIGFGGINGGANTLKVAVNKASADGSKTLPLRTVEQPPPSQNPECEPSGFISSATLFEIVVGPQGFKNCFQV